MDNEARLLALAALGKSGKGGSESYDDTEIRAEVSGLRDAVDNCQPKGEYATKDEVNELNESLVDLETIVSNTAIPSYWETAVSNATAKVKALQQAGGKNCVSFVWAADTHIPDSNGSDGKHRTNDIGKVMSKMLDNCDIPFAIISGDVGTRASYNTAELLDEQYAQLPIHLAPLWGTDRLLMALGNHDGHYGDSTCYYKKAFTPEKLWQIFFRGQSLDFRRVFSDDGFYFYVDNITQKTRFIILNSHFMGEYAEDENGLVVNNSMGTSCYGQEQLDWFSDVALDMPDGYSAIITMHAPLNTTYSVDREPVIGIINAYNNKTTFVGSYTDGVDGWSNSTVNVDFTDAKGKIIGVFAGHVHGDDVDTTTLNVPIVTILSAGATSNDHLGYVEPSRTGKTDTETAFDVVTINKETGVIYCTRVGAGNDRVIGITETYGISLTLNNCTATASNPTTIISNGRETLTFTANDGYELPTSVTVSGASYTWDNTTGTLVLISPTSDVSVTITATGVIVATNFAEVDVNNTTDWSKWINGYRIGSDGTGRNDSPDMIVTNYIPVENGDTVEYKGIAYGSSNCVMYTASKSIVNGAVSHLSGLQNANFLTGVDAPNNRTYGQFTINNSSCKFIRLGMAKPTDYGAVMFRIKRNGEYL